MNRISVKKLLKKEKFAVPFGGKYRFSPYMACGHKCTYCDGRYEKYHVKGDFDHQITLRENAADLLEKELPKLREAGPICISSGISDAYQPVEENLKITRQCAEVLSQFNHPVIVHTKSALILRDIDYWQEVNKKSAFTLMISLTMTENHISDKLEPGASSVEDRLKTVSEFRKRGMNAGILAMPFIPYLTDSRPQLETLLSALNTTEAQFAMPALLTLKKGRQKDYFLKTFKDQFPEVFCKVVDLYSNENFYGEPPESYTRKFYQLNRKIWNDSAMDDLIPHEVFKGQFSLYDEIRILLKDMIILYRRKNIDVTPLRSAYSLYLEWLTPKKQYYARRSNLFYSSLEDEVKRLSDSQELSKIIDNKKLAEFIHSIIQGESFDYQTLAFASRI